MDLRMLILGLLGWLARVSAVLRKEMTYDCCQGPLKIHIDPNNDYEFSIGSQAKVSIRHSNITAEPPFTAHGNESVTVDQCTNFSMITGFTDENGFYAENITQCLAQPCQTNRSLVIPLVVAFVVISVLIAIIIIVIVCLCRRRTSDGTVRSFQALQQIEDL